MSGWIGVDLDGTLAECHGGIATIGPPVPAMMARVRAWIEDGREVRIFTARACVPDLIPQVQAWLVEHGLPALEITNEKDFRMVALYDDRCVQVEMNTGRLIGDMAG